MSEINYWENVTNNSRQTSILISKPGPRYLIKINKLLSLSYNIGAKVNKKDCIVQ